MVKSVVFCSVPFFSGLAAFENHLSMANEQIPVFFYSGIHWFYIVTGKDVFHLNHVRNNKPSEWPSKLTSY